MGSSLTHKVVEGISVVQERVFSSPIHRILGEVSSGLQVPFVEQGGGDHEAFLAVPNRFIGNKPVNDTVTWMGPSERRLTLFFEEQGTVSLESCRAPKCLTCFIFPVTPRRKNEIIEIDTWKQKEPCKQFKKTSTCSLRSNACVKKLLFTNPLISSINDPELLLRAKFSNGYWRGPGGRVCVGGRLKGRSG